MTDAKTKRSRAQGIGARVLRREDVRHLHGEGSFVEDLRLPGLRHVAFVRSQIPHGRLESVTVPPGAEPGCVWTEAELAPFAEPLTATSTLPGYRTAPLPNLAVGKVRYVGEPIAVAIADSRAEAEDLAESIDVDIEPLPAVVDLEGALDPNAALLHEDWPDNVYARTAGDMGAVDAAIEQADVSITRRYVMNRQAVVPMETRAVAAHFDRSRDMLTLWTSTQTPHMIHDMVAEQLGLDGSRLRVIAPDVGGGFGAKCSVYPEEITLAAIAMQVPFPIVWVEDRWEAQVAMTQARDTIYEITAHADASGRLLAIEAEIAVNAGAYSVHPWTAAMDAGMGAAMVPGPYDVQNYRFSTVSYASNKAPLGPYRGVARPGACLAIERTMDDLAREVGIEPAEIRIRNMVGPQQMPYTSVARKVYDSGNYPEAVRRATRLIDHDRWRLEQQMLDPASRRRIGIGYASFTEQTAHGCLEWASRGLAITIGKEGARLVMDASGSFTLSVGVKSQGQGHETSLPQVVSEVFDIDVSRVTLNAGDTSLTPRGDGTFASRSMVMAGGATFGAASALADKVLRIAGVLLQHDPDVLHFHEGEVHSPSGASISLAHLAREFLFTPDHVPGVDGGLEETFFYEPSQQTGTYTYATHAAVVEVDLDTGKVRILDYGVVEDCGTVVNPLIVDGQIIGGVAQGIGTALLEELVYDEDGQPKSTSFLDYLLPGAAEIPEIKIDHMSTPSPFTVFGVKGAGESSAIAPPAALANAVSDALAAVGASINETPMTPLRVWEQIQAGSPDAAARPEVAS